MPIKAENEENENIIGRDKEQNKAGLRKKGDSKVDEKEGINEGVQEKANVKKRESSKKGYLRISITKKIDLAIYCRNYEAENSKTPKCKDLRKIFPWRKDRQAL